MTVIKNKGCSRTQNVHFPIIPVTSLFHSPQVTQRKSSTFSFTFFQKAANVYKFRSSEHKQKRIVNGLLKLPHTDNKTATQYKTG